MVSDRAANLAMYRDGLLAAGASVADADQAVSALEAVFDALDRCQCPKCGGTLTKTRDKQQRGPSAISGDWFNYRCACGFMMDRIEPVE